jgi:hypothetical protein
MWPQATRWSVPCRIAELRFCRRMCCFSEDGATDVFCPLHSWTVPLSVVSDSFCRVTKERCDRLVTTPAMCYGDPGFRSRPAERLLSLRFSLFFPVSPE